MRASLPSSMHVSTLRPSCNKKRGFTKALCASNIALRCFPSRGNLAAIEIAFFQSSQAAAFLRVCSFVSIGKS